MCESSRPSNTSNSPPPPKVAAIVLAAGGSTRFGTLKQLAPWREGTMLSQVVDTALASSARPVIVVLGNQAERCRAALGKRTVTIVVNEQWERGQSSSVQAGLVALESDVAAVLFLLADQPAISATTLDALVDRYDATRAPVVWPETAGRRGNPVLFDRVLFPELMRLTGDIGGRSVLESHTTQAERVSVEDQGILHDVDTPQDYQGSPHAA